MSVCLTRHGLVCVTPGKLFKTNWIGEVFGNLVSCTNLLPGEYRICSIMPVDPIPLDWQLACFVENFEAPWLSNEAHTDSEGAALLAFRRRGGSLTL